MSRDRRMRAAGSGALLTIALLGSPVAAAGVGLGPAGAAVAVEQAVGEPGVEVSEDGTHYSDDVDTPLFGPLGRLVPGDHESVTLWVRNSGDLAGRLRVSGADAWSTSAEFASAISIAAAVQDGAGAVEGEPVALGSASECALLVRGPLLEPGETAPVSVTVAFASAVTGRTGAEAQGGLDFVVALRDPADPASETADCASGTVLPGVPGDQGGSGAGGRDGRMADTGAAVAVPTVAAALAVMAGSATLALLALREGRRRRATR